MMIADTHVHIWDLQKAAYPWLSGDISILNQTWSIEQVEEDRIKSGVTAGILVQASGNLEDTDLMLETARRTDWIRGVVYWLPLQDPQKTLDLLEEKFLRDPYCVGVRHQVHDEQDSNWLLQPAVIESLKILASYDIPYDVVAVLPQHIETTLKVAEKVPELRMVFDHLSQPPIATKEHFGRWGDLMKIAAGHSNFFAKISGLGTASGNFQHRTAADIKPYVSFALENFGIERCFCGGDWPVSLLANSYFETWENYKAILQYLLTEQEQTKVFYANAQSFYKFGGI